VISVLMAVSAGGVEDLLSKHWEDGRFIRRIQEPLGELRILPRVDASQGWCEHTAWSWQEMRERP
jgi:hypothetical protein